MFPVRRAQGLFVVLIGAGVLGGMLRPLENEAWAPLRARAPRQLELNLGRDVSMLPRVTFALLGGFRSFAANVAWLRTNLNWERNDVAGTLAGLGLVTTLDPRPLSFWLNGARIIAYDMTHWRLCALAGDEPAAVRERIRAEQAERGLRFLDAARVFHPESPALEIECAHIHLRIREDVLAAAESYRRAALLPGAPDYASRIHAELLRKAGRKREAYDWLVRTAPRSGATGDGPMVSATELLSLERIRQLERELEIAEEKRFEIRN